MRTIHGLLAAVIFLASTAVVFAEDRYVSKDGGYSIQFPAGWTTKPRGQEVTGIDADGTVNVAVQVERLPNGMTVDRYIEMNTADQKKSLNEFKKNDSGTINVPAINSQARWISVSYKGDNGPLTVIYYHVFSVKDRKIFILICGGKPEAIEKQKAAFDGIAKSLVQLSK